jgi:uncharacterized protein DUF4411
LIRTHSSISIAESTRRIFFKTLWDNIDTEIQNDSLIIPREVHRELAQNDDELLKWVKARPKMIRPPDTAQTATVVQILARFPTLIDPTKTTPDADPFVIALAMAESGVVVTSEHLAGPGGRPKIPNACAHFKARYVNLLDYFRAKNWKY